MYMENNSQRYPNITWPQFAICNDDATSAFENMIRRLFEAEFLNGASTHSEHNNPGVEVKPILEPVHADGSKRRRISFQAKYFQNAVDYYKIQDSARKTVKYYGKELDVMYLFCNKTLTTTASGYKKTEEILEQSNIELCPISDAQILNLLANHLEIANYYFLQRKIIDDTPSHNPTSEMIKAYLDICNSMNFYSLMKKTDFTKAITRNDFFVLDQIVLKLSEKKEDWKGNPVLPTVIEDIQDFIKCLDHITDILASRCSPNEIDISDPKFRLDREEDRKNMIEIIECSENALNIYLKYARNNAV